MSIMVAQRKLSVLMVANGYPSQAREWKCPFNHRAAKALGSFCQIKVLAVRAWLPWRKSKTYSYDDIVVTELLIPPIQVIACFCLVATNLA